MNPDTNELERLRHLWRDLAGLPKTTTLLRPNGEPVPKHWSVFRVGEDVVVKDYTFRVAYMNEGTLILEPVGPLVIGETPDKVL